MESDIKKYLFRQQHYLLLLIYLFIILRFILTYIYIYKVVNLFTHYLLLHFLPPPPTSCMIAEGLNCLFLSNTKRISSYLYIYTHRETRLGYTYIYQNRLFSIIIIIIIITFVSNILFYIYYKLRKNA
jgi:hypothetical protein